MNVRRLLHPSCPAALAAALILALLAGALGPLLGAIPAVHATSITLVRRAQTTSPSNGLTVSATLSAVGAGDTLLVSVATKSSSGSYPAATVSSISDGVNTYIPAASNDNGIASYDTNVELWYAPNVAASAGNRTVTVTLSGNASTTYSGIIVSEYSGLASLAPIDVTATANATGSSSSAVIGPSAATVWTSDLVVGAAATDAYNYSSAASAQINYSNGASRSFALLQQDAMTAAIGTQTATMPFSTSGGYTATGHWAGVLVAFKSADAPILPGTPIDAVTAAVRNTSPINLTPNVAPSVGDLLLVMVSTYDTNNINATYASVADSANNVYSEVDATHGTCDTSSCYSTGVRRFQYFYRVATDTINRQVKVTYTGASYQTYQHVAVLTYRGPFASSGTLDVVNESYGNLPASPFSLAALTTTNAPDLLVGGISLSSALPVTAGSGYRLDANAIYTGYGQGASESQTVASTGTYTPTLAFTGSRNNQTFAGISAAFKIQTVPNPPINVSVSSITTSSAVVGWASGGGPAATYYRIYNAAHVQQGGDITPGTATSATVSGLAAGTLEAGWTIVAYNASGPSANAPIPTFTTLTNTPGAPTGVSVMGTTPTTATFAWTAPTWVGTGGITGYRIYDASSVLQTWSADPGTGTMGTVVGLAAGTQFSGWKIVAFNTYGNGATADIPTFTTPLSTPSAPLLAPVSDTGSSASDRLTGLVNGLVFTGTSDPNVPITLWNGATQIGSGVADASGNWAVITTVPIPANATLAITAKEGFGAPTAVQSTSIGYTTTQVSSLTPTFSSPTSAGDTLVALLTQAVWGISTPTSVPTGWQLVTTYSQGSEAAYLYVYPNAPSMTSPGTWSWGINTGASLLLAEYANVNGAAYTVSGPFNNGTNNPSLGPINNPYGVNALFVAGLSEYCSSNILTAGGGFTMRAQRVNLTYSTWGYASGQLLDLVSGASTATATTTPAINSCGTTGYAGLGVVFAPAAGGAMSAPVSVTTDTTAPTGAVSTSSAWSASRALSLPYVATDTNGIWKSDLYETTTPAATSTYATLVAGTAGLLGDWRLGETSGTTAADASGLGHPGTYLGGPTLGVAGALPGDANTAVSFSGSPAQYVNVPYGTSITGSYSVEAWVYPTNTTSTMTIVSGRAHEMTFDFKLMNGNLIHGDIGTGTAWLTTAADATFNYAANTWYHIVYTVTSTGYTIYANGVAVGAGSYTAATPMLTDGTTALVIGNYMAGGSEGFAGSIDEPAIYARALSSTEVAAQYAAARYGYTRITSSLGAPGTFSWTAPDDGAYYFYALATDNAGNIAAVPGSADASTTVDTVAPAGTVVINAGAPYTTAAAVTLTLTATDATSGLDQMRFSNDGTTWSGWQTYATSAAWTLSAGDGPKTVHAQYQDHAGNVSVDTTDAIILDTVAPAGTVVINAGAPYTTAAAVTLTLTATDATSGLDQMRFSNDGTTWSGWQTYATSAAWTLSAGDGPKTVHAQYQDHAGNVSVDTTDAIILDTVAPAGTVVINAGAPYTTAAAVTLTLTATDATSGLDQMRFSNDGTTWSGWQTYATSAAWTLSAGDGPKTVHAQYQDHAGNVSSDITSVIILDTLPPAAPAAPHLDPSSDTGQNQNDGVTALTAGLVFTGTTEAGATVAILNGATILGAGTADDAGNYAVVTTQSIPANATTPITAQVTDMAGNTGAVSAATAVTTAPAAMPGPASFRYPLAVAADSTYAYLADTRHDRIIKIRLSDLAVVAVTGTHGTGTGQFIDPSGIATDSTSVYVADTGNDRIVKLAAADLSWSGSSGTFGAGTFVAPRGVATDGVNVYVADTGNNRLVKLTLSLASVLAAGGFAHPAGIAVGDGALLVADTGNDRVVQLDPATLTITGDYGTTGSADNQLSSPSGVATDGTDVYVADTGNNRLVKLTLGTLTLVATVGAGAVNQPAGLTVDASKTQLLVADAGNDRLATWSLSGGAAVPVSGATVSWDDLTATTDAAGQYDLPVPVGTHDLLVAAPGYTGVTVPSYMIVGNQIENITLVPGSTVNGLVQDSNGSPLAGVAVTTSNGTVSPATTGADGAFVISAVAAPAAPVTATVTITLTKTGYATQSLSPTISAGQTIAVTATLPTAGDISGTVSKHGTPVSGIVVCYSASATCASTDTSGFYQINDLVTSAGTLTVNDPAYTPYSAPVSVVGGSTTTANVALYGLFVQIGLTPTGAQSVASGATLAWSAAAEDDMGYALPAQPTFTWSVTSGTGSATITQAGVLTGVHAGTVTVTAAAGSINASNTQVTVVPGPLATITLAPMGAQVVAGGGTLSFTATGRDAAGNVLAPQPTYTWSLTSGPGGVSSSGVFTAGLVGVSVVHVTANGISADSGTITTIPGALATITLSPSGPQALTSGGTLTFTATGKDSVGNLLSPQPTYTWAVASGGGTISSGGLYTAPSTSTTATVSATSGSITGTSGVITVTNPNQPTVFVSGGFGAIPSLVEDPTGTYIYVGDELGIAKITVATGAMIRIATYAAVCGGVANNSRVDGLALGSDGNLYAMCYGASNSVIKKVTTAGAVTTFANVNAFDTLITGDLSGNLYYDDGSSGHVVHKITIAGANITTFAGSGVSGCSDGGVGTGLLNYSRGGETWTGSALYFGDYFDHAIRRAPSTASMTTFAGNCTTSGDTDGTGTGALFSKPTGMTGDGTYLYVSEQNGYIRRVRLSDGLTVTIAKIGFGLMSNSLAMGPNGILYIGAASQNAIYQLPNAATLGVAP